MKKGLIRLLTLILTIVMIMGLYGTAWAAPGDQMYFYRESENDEYQQLQSVAGDGKTLYVVKTGAGNEQTELIAMDVQSGEIVTWASDLPVSYYANLEEFTQYSQGDPNQVITQLFMANGNPVALNGLTGQISKLSFDGSAMKFEKLGQIDPAILRINMPDYSYYKEIWGVYMNGDMLYLSTYNYEAEPKSELLCADLKTGETNVIRDTFAHELVPYKDGKIITFKYDPDKSYDTKSFAPLPREIHSIDLTTGQSQKLFTADEYAVGLAYDAQNDSIYYAQGSTVIRVASDGKKEKVAYLPSSNSYSTLGVSFGSGLYAFASYDGIAIRNTDPTYLPSTVLTIYGSYSSEADIAFQKANPDVALNFTQNYYTSVEELAQGMTASDAIDIVALYSADMNMSLSVLINKGYALDLSAYPELTQAASNLYPYIQEYLSKDGALYAIAYAGGESSDAYYTETLKAMELTEDDIPGTYPELFEFITRWNDEFVYDFPDYIPFYTDNIRRDLLYRMIGDYVYYMNHQGEELTFSTPLFKSLMTAFDAMQTDNLDDSGEGEEMWSRQALFQTGGYQTVDFSQIDPEKGNTYFKTWQLKLSEDAPVFYPTYLQTMFINPKSAHKDAAAAYLLNTLKNIPSYTRSILDASMNENVENPYYQTMIKTWQDEYDRLKENLKTADESQKKEMEQMLTEYEKLLEDKELYRYSVTTQALDYYRTNFLANSVVDTGRFLDAQNAQSLRDLIDQYLGGSRTVDQFLGEFEKKTRMMILEAK